MKIILSLLVLSLLCALCEASAVTSEITNDSLLQCPTEDFCAIASQCCIEGMDSYGWIAAAVGWSLWFLTLILFCVGKVMDLRPAEPKYFQA
ncbi:transmembrane protein 213 [Pelodytes ibericus]